MSLVLLGAMTLAGCASEPGPLAEQHELLAQLAPERLPQPVRVAPLSATYAPRPFPLDDEPVEAGAPDQEAQTAGVLAWYEPPLDAAEVNRQGTEVREVLGYCFERDEVRPVSTTAGPAVDPSSSDAGVDQEPSGSLPLADPLFEQAERDGGQLLLRTHVTRNRLTYRGTAPVAQLLDTALLLSFPPLHLFVGDEVFELERELELEVFDVRDPARPLHTARVRGDVRMQLNELEHGYVVLNGLRAWLGDPARFSGEHLRRAYQLLEPHVERRLQENLLREVDLRLRSVLQSPQVREQLERGDPTRARLYGLVIGQNAGQARFAQRDARELARALRAQSDLGLVHVTELAGEVTRARLEAALDELRVKAVDRLVVFFSGEGRETARGQALTLEGDELLPVVELARLVRSARGVRAEQVAFVLDTSFGDADRGAGRGGRTAAGSSPPARADSYLTPLADVDRGWRVVCAAGPGEVTGEYQGHGLLTRFLIEHLGDPTSPLTLEELELRLEEPLAELARALLGGKHSLFVRGARGRFALRR